MTRPSRKAPRSMARSDALVCSVRPGTLSRISRWPVIAVSGFFSSCDTVAISWLL